MGHFLENECIDKYPEFINLKNIDQETLEKTDGAAKSGQFRNMSHVGLKSSNDDTQHRIQQ
jgi:hypothetical protein